MHDPNPEIVRIGVSGARILEVARERIYYVDEAGKEQSIDLEECARAWNRLHDEQRADFRPLPGTNEEGISAWNARCVGRRGSSEGFTWVEFMNERQTRFEFAEYGAFHQEIRRPLAKAGWHTFDND